MLKSSHPGRVPASARKTLSISTNHAAFRCKNVNRAPGSGMACRASVGSSEGLLAWAQKQGIDMSKAPFTVTPKEGTLTLVAARDIAAGETVLAVPSSAWLTPEAADKSRVGQYVKNCEGWVKLCVYLMAERAAGPSSPLSAYLSAAPGPEGHPSPLFWTEAELAEIKGTQLMDKVQGYRAFLTGKFEELERTVFAPNRAQFPEAAFSLDSFTWAFATVRGRAHEPLTGEKLALVPLADMVAHRRAGNVAWKAGKGGLFGIGDGGSSLAVEATSSIRAGDTLSMDFGPGKLDNQVALDYGVVDVYDRRGGLALTLGIDEGDKNTDDKLDVLEQAGLGADGSAEFQLTAGGEIPEDMLATLRLQSLGGSDAFLLESIFRNDIWGHLLLPVSEANERAVCSGMAAAARSAAEARGGPSVADVQALRQVAPGSRREVALVVRLGEKEALEGASLFFEERLGKLQGIEYYQERRLKRLGLLDDRGRSTWNSFFEDGVA